MQAITLNTAIPAPVVPPIQEVFCPLLGKPAAGSPAHAAARWLLQHHASLSDPSIYWPMPQGYSLTDMTESGTTTYALYVYEEVLEDYIYLLSARISPGNKAHFYDNRFSSGHPQQH